VKKISAKLLKMVLIIQVFTVKSTLLCKKNTNNGIDESGSKTKNTKRVNLNVIGKFGATKVVASFRTDDQDANRSSASRPYSMHPSQLYYRNRPL
jgi:hypothetical protein